jgi:hypothetical protein
MNKIIRPLLFSSLALLASAAFPQETVPVDSEDHEWGQDHE